MQGYGRPEAYDDDVSNRFAVTGMNLGQLAKMGDWSQGVNSRLVYRFVVFIKDSDAVSVGVDNGREELTVVL